LIGIILAGGPPKQLRHVTGSETPRPFVKVVKELLVERHVRGLQRHVDRLYLVSDHPIAAEFCRRTGSCSFIEQRAPGIEGAICSAVSTLRADDQAVIVYGDIYAETQLLDSAISKSLEEGQNAIAVALSPVSRASFMRVKIEDPLTGRIAKLGEGPFVFAGVMVMSPRLLAEGLCQGGTSVQEFLNQLARAGRLVASTWRGFWVDVDTPWDLMIAVRLELMKLSKVEISSNAKVSERATLEPPVYIEGNVVVDHNAVVKGPVYLASGSFVGAHSFVREYVAIMEGARIGAYAEVKRSVVYDGVRISSFSYITDSIIGSRASVAPYTVTLNIPSVQLPEGLALSAIHPFEPVKVGAIISAASSTRPFQVLQPGELYLGE
jgi:glucose-1-phosphate thymidylyltransferase